VVFVVEMLIALAVAVVIVALAVRQSRKWQTVFSATGKNAEQAEAKMAYLRSHGIKCKLKTGAGPETNGIQGMGDGSRKAVLKVHKNDVEKAADLLKQYSEE